MFPTAGSAEPLDAASDPEAPEEPDRSPRVPTFSVQGDLAGELGVFETRYEDTFAGIGNRLAMGYLELVKANPGVDPWLPGEGTTITLPRQYVLPDARREGIVIKPRRVSSSIISPMGVCRFTPWASVRRRNPSPLTDAEVTMPLESPAWYPPASIRAEYEASGEYLPPDDSPRSRQSAWYPRPVAE